MTNDFLVFSGDGAANVIDQSTYAAMAARIVGFQSGVAQSAQFNKVWRQSSIMAAVLAQFIVDMTDQNVVDDGTVATILANLKAGIRAQSVSVVGEALNLTMNVTAASATATLAADELVVKSALGGRSYLLGNFSQSINLGATGAGGMDTGAVPTNGWVGVYAIYNPLTAARALLAVNATSGLVAETYAGTNMPAGYTASALVSVRRTNSNGQFAVSYQRGRRVDGINGLVLNGGGATTYTSFSISGVVPPSGKSVFMNGNVILGATTPGNGFRVAAEPIAEIGLRPLANPVANGVSAAATLGEIALLIPQTLFYRNDVVSAQASVFVTGYTF